MNITPNRPSEGGGVSGLDARKDEVDLFIYDSQDGSRVDLCRVQLEALSLKDRSVSRGEEESRDVLRAVKGLSLCRSTEELCELVGVLTELFLGNENLITDELIDAVCDEVDSGLRSIATEAQWIELQGVLGTAMTIREIRRGTL